MILCYDSTIMVWKAPQVIGSSFPLTMLYGRTNTVVPFQKNADLMVASKKRRKKEAVSGSLIGTHGRIRTSGLPLRRILTNKKRRKEAHFRGVAFPSLKFSLTALYEFIFLACLYTIMQKNVVFKCFLAGYQVSPDIRFFISISLYKSQTIKRKTL